MQHIWAPIHAIVRRVVVGAIVRWSASPPAVPVSGLVPTTAATREEEDGLNEQIDKLSGREDAEACPQSDRTANICTELLQLQPKHDLKLVRLRDTNLL